MLMKWMKSVAIGVCAVLVSAASPAFGQTTSEGRAVAAANDTAASGVVTNNGRPEAGADIVLIAWPSQAVLDASPEGGTAPLHIVGTTTTDKDGRFAINIDPASLPAWTKDQNSRVDLELQVANDLRQLYFNYTIEAVPAAQRTRAGGSWAALASASAPSRRTAPDMRFDLGVPPPGTWPTILPAGSTETATRTAKRDWQRPPG